MTEKATGPAISLMLAVSDARAAAEWYARALGAAELWSLGTVVGLEIGGAPIFLAQPDNNGWESPAALGTTTVRVEVFVDDPDAFVARAVAAGADGRHDPVRDHQAPWGIHRQGGFFDPFGHLWLVGDRSPLNRISGQGALPAASDELTAEGGADDHEDVEGAEEGNQGTDLENAHAQRVPRRR